MSRNAWRDSATTDVLFPDDLAGYGPIAVVGAPIPAEEADTDTVRYGVVATLDGDHHAEDYVVAPKALRSAIADAWRDDDEMAVFEVLEAEKSGPEDDAAWVIETRTIDNGDPL